MSSTHVSPQQIVEQLDGLHAPLPWPPKPPAPPLPLEALVFPPPLATDEAHWQSLNLVPSPTQLETPGEPSSQRQVTVAPGVQVLA
jgi:hypothetical protein